MFYDVRKQIMDKDKDKEILKQFSIFLKDNNAYYCFIKNINFDFEYIHRKTNTYAYSIICGAFIWDDTPQGHLFWENLDYKWRSYLIEQK